MGTAPSDDQVFASGRHTAADWRARLQKGIDLDSTKIVGLPFTNPSQDQIIPDAPPVTDLTDQTVQRAALAARRRLMAGNSTTSNFLTGPLGAGTPTGSAPTATGG